VLGSARAVLSRVLAREFPAVVRARGATYYERRAVKIEAASNSEVHATVRGSDVYAVMLSVGRTRLGASCTCPYFESEGRCKHVWATMLAAEARGTLALPPTMTTVEGPHRLEAAWNHRYPDCFIAAAGGQSVRTATRWRNTCCQTHGSGLMVRSSKLTGSRAASNCCSIS